MSGEQIPEAQGETTYNDLLNKYFVMQ